MNRTIENIIQGLSRSLFGYRNSQRGGRCRKLAFLQEDAVERGAILRIRIKYWWPAWYRLMRIHESPSPPSPNDLSLASLSRRTAPTSTPLILYSCSLSLSPDFCSSLLLHFDASYDEPFRVLFAPRDMPCLLGESISQPIHITEIRKRGGINEKFS